MTLAVEAIGTRDAMDALREEWEALAALDPDRSPFSSYDWYRCCLEDPEGAALHALAVRAEGRLVGVAPLARRIEKGRWGASRAVGFIRCRETPFADLVVDPGLRREVAEAICRHLFQDDRRSWDLLLLGPWPEASPNYAAMMEALRSRGARLTERTASLVPVVLMDRDWDSFWGSRSYLFRKSRRGILNRMAKLGSVEVEAYRADETGKGLRELFQVADRAWKREEGIAVTSREESKRFFTALTEAAGRRGWLLLWVLRLDGRPIAVEYNLAENGVAYALRADFDQEHRQHSPGAFLEYQILHRLFADGYRAYCAGPGFDAYKLRWTEEVRRNVTVTVYNRGVRNELLWAAEGWLIPRLKRLQRRFGSGGEGEAAAPERAA